MGALALGCVAAGSGGVWGAAETSLPPIDDLASLAAAARESGALALVLFTLPGCPYCEQVRRLYLSPRLAEQVQLARPTLLIREVDITSRRLMGEIEGKKVTEEEFALRFGVAFAPVVMFFDASMQPLGEPLVGLDAAGFYEARLTRAIDEARALQRRR